MRLSSTLAGLAVLATAATAQHIDIQPKELKGMVDGPWEGKKYTWEMMPAIPSLEKSYCTEPTDPHQVAQTTSQDGEPLVSDCQAMSLAVPEDTLWSLKKNYGYQYLRGWGKCRFGVNTDEHVDKPNSISDIYMVSSDIKYLINHSIGYNSFTNTTTGEKVVGAKGQTVCGTGFKGRNITISWSLFRFPAWDPPKSK